MFTDKEIEAVAKLIFESNPSLKGQNLDWDSIKSIYIVEAKVFLDSTVMENIRSILYCTDSYYSDHTDRNFGDAENWLRHIRNHAEKRRNEDE